MDQRGSYCPYSTSSETTARGTGLEKLAGQEDPVAFDSTLELLSESSGCS